MPISLNTDKNTGERKRTNFFTETVKIVSAEAHYCQKQKWQKFQDDLGLTLTLDIGKSFEPEWYLGGNYKKNETSGEIVGWSTVWSGIGMLFRAVGMPIDCPKGDTPQSAVFPQNLLDSLTGKEFVRLKYRSSTRTDKNGNPKWVEYSNTDKLGCERELSDKFRRDIKDGWVKDFLDPENDSHPLSGKVEKTFTAEPDAVKDNDIHEGLPV